MYISAKPISCNSYVYEIEIFQLRDVGSDIIFGGLELNFGDGTVEEIEYNDYDFYEEYDENAIIKTIREHAFPGPGVYTISVRLFNRTPDIQNMSRSVNTPLYSQSKITIDPLIGCNSTPKLEILSHTYLSGQNYSYDFSFVDTENDSLSYYLTTPQQSRQNSVVDYGYPSDYEPLLNQKISCISIDPYNGSVLLNSKNLVGNYTIALKIEEWRKINGVYLQISSSVLDHSIVFVETENTPPQLSDIQDTAIIVGQHFTQNIIASDPENDSILFNCYGDFFQFPETLQTEHFDYAFGPIQKNISFTPSVDNARKKPYKAVFSMIDKNENGSLNNTKSIYLWIADKIHTPDSVKLFTGQEINSGVITLTWMDVEDELGYIIERADQHFPDFERLVVLPADLASFNDPSVVDGKTYQYRIKAVGTTMSGFATTIVSTSDIITSLKDNAFTGESKIYPNPSNGSFWIHDDLHIKSIEIFDLSGKIVWKTKPNPTLLQKEANYISTNLSKGIYIVNLSSIEDVYSQKVIIN